MLKRGYYIIYRIFFYLFGVHEVETSEILKKSVVIVENRNVDTLIGWVEIDPED
jgi:hypothetical protein